MLKRVAMGMNALILSFFLVYALSFVAHANETICVENDTEERVVIEWNFTGEDEPDGMNEVCFIQEVLEPAAVSKSYVLSKVNAIGVLSRDRRVYHHNYPPESTYKNRGIVLISQLKRCSMPSETQNKGRIECSLMDWICGCLT